MTELYAQIEDYLSGALQGEARAHFEMALQQDAGLAAEVALYRDMAAALAPTQEDALRDNLQRLGEKYAPGGPAHSRRWWIGGAILLLAGLSWWLWPSGRPAPVEVPIEKKIPAAPDVLPAVPAQKPVTPAIKTPTESQKPLKDKPVAANFQPNPRLEALLGSQLRGDEYRFRIFQPAAGAQLSGKGSQAVFQLSGLLTTTALAVKPPFRVLLFSNRAKDFEDFHPVFSQGLVFQKTKDGFQFQLKQTLPLTNGLYYVLIEDQESGMIYHVRKIVVR